MLVVHVLAAAAGAALAVVTVLSAIRTVVLPRAAGSLITRVWFVAVGRVFTFAARGRDFPRRDRILAYYAPVALIALPGVWVALVIIGFTGIFWGTGVHPLRDAFLLSGSSVLTLGIAFRRALPHAGLSFAEATLGLGLVALLISYLPSIYAAFARREVLVGKLEVRAGSPPSPAMLLARYSRIGLLDQVDSELFGEWEHWFMEVEESHTNLPSLVFLRSPVPERNWVTAAGCMLDTASIVLSTLKRPPGARVTSGTAALMIRTGFFSLRRIADYFGIDYDHDPSPDHPISVTRREYDLVCTELAAAGLELHDDRDEAWRHFAGWRVNYDTVLIALAELVDAPPAPWSSDRAGLRRPRPKLFRRGRKHATAR